MDFNVKVTIKKTNRRGSGKSSGTQKWIDVSLQ